MTLQDDLVHPWFQPAVPPEPQPEQPDRPQPEAGPVNTRFVGELPLDAAPPAPQPPFGGPAPAARPQPGPQQPEPETAVPPERVEVTQPYIPAIRDERPEFAKRLNPDPPGQAPQPGVRPEGTVADLAPVTPPAAAPASSAPPAAAPAQAPSAPGTEQPAPAAQPAQQDKPRQPVRRRSLARRVVRKIIGPDLLRKDPPKPKKKS